MTIQEKLEKYLDLQEDLEEIADAKFREYCEIVGREDHRRLERTDINREKIVFNMWESSHCSCCSDSEWEEELPLSVLYDATWLNKKRVEVEEFKTKYENT